MSGFDSLLSKVSATYAQIARAEIVARENPGDFSALSKVRSLKEFVSQLESEWEDAARHRQMEVCRYRMISRHSDNYLVKSVSRSVIEFQELFSQVHDALENGPKQRARISGEVLRNTNLNIAFTYPGSLGMVFTIPGESSLVGDKFDSTVDAIYNIVEVDDEDEVRELTRTLGEAVVKRAFDWSVSNYDAGYGVDVLWTTSSGKKKGDMIAREEFGYLVEIINRTSDREVRTFRVSGTLVGLDVATRRFRFVEFGTDGGSYAGSLDQGFVGDTERSVPSVYQATIRVEAVTVYATQKTDERYFLEELEDGVGKQLST